MKRAYLFCCFSFSLHAVFASAEPLLWGKLKAGPYRVGYTTSWTQDDSRSFEATLPDGSQFGGSKTPRPILLMEWYPAVVKSGQSPMVQSDYLTLAPTTGKLHEVSESLIQSSRDNIASEVAGAQDSSKLDTMQQAALERYLKATTMAYRNAPQSSGRYPLVIYVHGNGSSFEDDTVLCEYLASQGFVVLDSAYQDENLNMIAGYAETGDDVRFLVQYGRKLANVDDGKVGLVGHSGGAQSILMYQSIPGAMSDAIVSLDTTEDYAYTDNLVYKRKFVDVLDMEQINIPMLFAANPQASFQLADEMKNSHRYYLTLRDTRHNEFISHGLAHAIVYDTPTRGSIEAKYNAICENIAGFFRTVMHVPYAIGQSAWPVTGDLDFKNKTVNVEEVPVGVDSPPSYTSASVPPSPRQFRAMIVEHKYDEAAALLVKFSQEKAWSPIYGVSRSSLIIQTIDHLLAFDQVSPARRFGDLCTEIYPGVNPETFLLGQGSFFLHVDGGREEAIAEYRRALALQPDDPKAIEGLKQAEALPEQGR